jgi:hypothetical protein
MSLSTPEIPNADVVISYLHDNYYDDCERMAHIKMIAALASPTGNDYTEDIPQMIDKVALFNGIKKSYPPKKTVGQRIIEGIGFILYKS